MEIKKILTSKKLILFLTIVVFVFVYILTLFLIRDKLPDTSGLVVRLESIYGEHGYYLVFLGALLEATFLLGFYVPGSLVVFLGVSLARLGITSFPLVIIFGTIGFCIGYSLNYFLGRFGWYRLLQGFGLEKKISETEENLRHHFDRALFWGYVMPSTGSLISTVSGILRVPYRVFILKTLIVQTFWSLFLGGLAYVFGMTFIHMFLVYFGFVAFFSIVLYLLHNVFRRHHLPV